MKAKKRVTSDGVTSDERESASQAIQPSDHQTTKPSNHPATCAMVAVGRLHSSAWNTHAKETRKDAAFDELCRSIERSGILQRLAVRPLHDEVEIAYEVVDGHRRLEAAKAAGLAEVPCEIREMDDDEARAATLAANLQRLENDPLMEAELIERMVKDGRSHEWIAAAIGKDARYVARRGRLTMLEDCWRKSARVTQGEKPGAATLEMIARHDRGLQLSVWKSLKEGHDDIFAGYDTGDIEETFRMRMCRLSDANFDTERFCTGCAKNTAAHKFLFEAMDEEERGNARCMCADCYVKRWNEATDATLRKLREEGVKVVEVSSKYDMPQYWNATGRKERGNVQPYLYTDSRMKKILWSVPESAAKSGAAALTEEEREAAKAEKRRRKLVKSAREKLRTLMRDEFKGGAFENSVAFDELAARRLRREMRRSTWYSDDFVDDWASVEDAALDGLEADERTEYKAEIEAKEQEAEDDGE